MSITESVACLAHTASFDFSRDHVFFNECFLPWDVYHNKQSKPKYNYQNYQLNTKKTRKVRIT